MRGPQRPPGLGADFRRLFVASTASNVGDGVLLAALPLLAHRLTRDPVAIASVTVAATMPWLAFGLVAGTLVDRTDRLGVMTAGNVVRAVVVAGLALSLAVSGAGIGVVLVAVFVLGAAETLVDTAAQAWLPSVVPPEQLEHANGRLFGAQVAANSFVGPPLGAALFGLATVQPFAAAGAMFLLGATVLGSGRGRPRPGRPARVSTGRRASVARDIGDGLAWLWRDRGVRAFAVGAAVVNLAHTASMAVAVLLLRDDLGVSAGGFGVTLAAAAVGGLAGTQAAAPVVRAVGRRVAAVAAVATFAVSLLVVGLAGHAAVVALGLAIFGAAGEVWNVVAVSYRQARVPDALLGRVMATYRFIAYGAMPVGAALGGVIARAAGVRAVFVSAAAIVLGLLAYLIHATRGGVLQGDAEAA